MRLAVCLEVGFVQLPHPDNAKGCPQRIPLAFEKRLRNGTGGRAIVVVGIVEPVRVELDPVVVEVEVRGVVEAIIGIRIFVLTRPWHQSLKVILVGNKARSHSCI